jgi:hypothetical protein
MNQETAQDANASFYEPISEAVIRRHGKSMEA